MDVLSSNREESEAATELMPADDPTGIGAVGARIGPDALGVQGARIGRNIHNFDEACVLFFCDFRLE